MNKSTLTRLDSITSYMTKHSLPPLSNVASKTLEAFKTLDMVVIVAYFAAGDTSLNETSHTVGDSMHREFVFGVCNNHSLAKAEGLEQPSVVLYKEFGEGKNVLNGNFDTASIIEFAKSAGVPLIQQMTAEVYTRYGEVSIEPPLDFVVRVLIKLCRLVSLWDIVLLRLLKSVAGSLKNSQILLRRTRARSTLQWLMLKRSVLLPQD